MLNKQRPVYLLSSCTSEHDVANYVLNKLMFIVTNVGIVDYSCVAMSLCAGVNLTGIYM